MRGGNAVDALTADDLRDMRQRVIRGESSIEAEAVRYSLPQLVNALRITRGMLQTLAERWAPDQLQVRPTSHTGVGVTDDRWSATEAITHLIATQNWYLLHIGRLLGRREHFGRMPHGLGDLALQDVAKAELEADLARATGQLVAALDAVPASADLAARRDSTFFGELSLRGWALLAIIHDLDHLAQIERLADLPEFPQ
jgi:hypothetical protein